MVRIKGRRESESGANTHYQLNSGEVITRAEGVRRVQQGKMPGYHTVKINDVKYLRDNPDKNIKDNIDSQKLI